MPEPSIQASAELILKLYELRRDPEMRQARQWFAQEFRPAGPEDILRLLLSGERGSAAYRMVTSYWDMVGAMVKHGAIDQNLFRDSGGEYIAFFALLEPYLEGFRAVSKEADYLQNWEALVRETPGSSDRMESRRRLFSSWTSSPK